MIPVCYPPSCLLCGFSFHIFTYAICWLASLGSFTWFTSPSRLLLDKTKLSWRLSWTDKCAKWYPFPKYQSSIQRMTEPEETSGQCGTWTSLDENRQEILLDVCPSIHLWKIAVMGWKTGSKRNIMYFGDRCPTHHSHPGRTFPLMWLLSNPWCSKWHARDERNVSRQNSGRRGSPMGTTEEENPQQQTGPVTSLGTHYQEGWGTTMHCLEYQHSKVCKISRRNPPKHRDALGGSHGGGHSYLPPFIFTYPVLFLGLRLPSYLEPAFLFHKHSWYRAIAPALGMGSKA